MLSYFPVQIRYFCSAFVVHMAISSRTEWYIFPVCTHFGAQQGKMFHLMLSASHREREAIMKHCLALIDSGYSLAADTDLAERPGILSLWSALNMHLLWHDTSLTGVFQNFIQIPWEAELWQRAGSLQAVTIFSYFLFFKDTTVAITFVTASSTTDTGKNNIICTVFSHSSGVASEMAMSVALFVHCTLKCPDNYRLYHPEIWYR